MIEYAEAHYEVQEVEMGEIYAWRPESVVVECDCDKRPTLTASTTICGGVARTTRTSTRERLDAGRLGEHAVDPWRYIEDRGDARLPY